MKTRRITRSAKNDQEPKTFKTGSLLVSYYYQNIFKQIY